MVYSTYAIGYEREFARFLKNKHCGSCTKDGLRDYLLSIGWKCYPTFYFHVDTQYEEVSKEDKGYDPEYPFRLKSMQICLSDDDEYYSWEGTERFGQEFLDDVIGYFEGKGYPLGAFMKEGGGDDAQKIDQFFHAMIRDNFKPYRHLKYVEPNT